jgi:sugar O-acyltransferase (sialic acid O-acetyltransferase NeuD family)
MGRTPVILVGGGGHAGVVLDACRAAGIVVVGVVDDDPDCQLAKAADGVAWLGRPGGFVPPDGAGLLLTLGDLGVRRRLLATIDPGLVAPAVVHPAAAVGSGVVLGDGVVVLAGAVINRDARIGAHGIVNTGSIVEHDCVVGENCHLAPGSVLGGQVTVGNDTLVGIRAGVRPGVRIGRGCTVGVGAAVVGDVADGLTVVGVPARAIR